jgi:hypothetical protein
LPENHRYAETANEINTAINMNISETLTIDSLLLNLFLSYFSQKPHAATIKDPTANPACDRSIVSPGISNTKGIYSRTPNGNQTAHTPAHIPASQPIFVLNFDCSTISPYDLAFEKIRQNMNPEVQFYRFLNARAFK